jgi:hypothetical protein
MCFPVAHRVADMLIPQCVDNIMDLSIIFFQDTKKFATGSFSGPLVETPRILNSNKYSETLEIAVTGKCVCETVAVVAATLEITCNPGKVRQPLRFWQLKVNISVNTHFYP